MKTKILKAKYQKKLNKKQRKFLKSDVVVVNIVTFLDSHDEKITTVISYHN